MQPSLARLRRRIAAGSATPRGEAIVAAAAGVGALAGALFAEATTRLIPLSTRAVEAARASGVISATVRAGYPKDTEFWFLAIGLLFTALGALLAGGAVAWSRGAAWPGPAAAASAEPQTRFGLFEVVVVIALLVLGAHPSPLVTSGAEWRVLHEEGVHLLPAHILHLGGRLYQDVDYLYGPLLALPLAFGFSIGDPSVFTARIATLVLHGIGLALIAVVARACFRSRGSWLVFCVALLFLVPLPFPRAHLTALRSAATLLPLLLLPAAFRGQRGATFAAGAATAPAVFVGPEIGLVTVVVSGLAIALGPADGGRTRRLAVFVTGVAGGSAVISALLLPYADVARYLREGASTLGSIGAGYLARPYPVPWGADRLWRGDPHGVGLATAALAGRGTALLGLLSACGLLLAFRWFRRPLSGREWLAVAAWGIALGLLPKLIVRPGSLQFYKVLPPLLIASGLLVEDAVFAALRRRGLARLAPGILSLTLLLALVPFVNARLPRWPASLPNLDARLGSIPVDPAFASLVGKVRAAVDRRLPAGEPIWVRDAPGWYLLLDRPPADRSPAIIWLATADQRRAVVERVSARPPSLVLRHRMRDELDGIPMEAYAPEVDDFIASNYRLAERVRAGRFSVELMERVAPPG